MIPESSPGRGKGPSAAPHVDRPQIPPQDPEKIDSAPGQIAPGPAAQDPLAPLQRGEGWGEGLAAIGRGRSPGPSPGLDPGADLLPVIPESSPGRGKGRSAAPPTIARKFRRKSLEKIEFRARTNCAKPGGAGPPRPASAGRGSG